MKRRASESVSCWRTVFQGLVLKQRRPVLLLLGLLLLAPRWALAEPPSGDAASQAHVHFDRGVQLYKEGSLDTALAEFLRAYDLVRDYRLLYNIAQVQAERHDYVRAIEAFSDYLKQGGGAIQADRRAEVDNETARLRQRVAQLVISTNVPGGELWINGRLATRLPASAPVLVNAGLCTIRIANPGYRSFTRELEVTGGDTKRLDVELEADASSAPTSMVARNNTWLWLTLTATGALTAGSITFGILAKNANKTLDNRLDEYPPNANQIEDARKNVRTNALACDILGGAAILGAGTTLYFLLNPSYEPITRAGATAPKPTARLVPSPTGVFLDGTF